MTIKIGAHLAANADATADTTAAAIVKSTVEKWSVVDQADWYAAYPPNPHAALVLGKSSVGWVSQKNMAKVLDQFGRTVARDLPHLMSISFHHRLNPDALLYFVDDLVDSADDGTIRQYLEMLKRYYERLTGEIATPSVRKIVKFFKSRPRGGGKRPRVRSKEMWEAAETAMMRILADVQQSGRSAMTPSEFANFRNICAVAFLTTDPLRLRNFTEMELERHLNKSFSRFKLQYAANEMKGRGRFSAVVDVRMTKFIDAFLQQRRLVCEKHQIICGNRVWVDCSGAALSPAQIHNILTSTTQTLVGERLSAHQFRYMLGDSAKAEGATNTEIGVTLQHHRPSQVTDGYIKKRNMIPHSKNRESFSKLLAKVGNIK